MNFNEKLYYIEVKGYEKDADKYKWESVRNLGFKLEVWFNETITKYEKLYDII
ncbi:hypothetical protein M0P65_06785 [Candidatus Gracilibacteria bacterium]|jgi:hypothetical protein|nr:hypothetical protein [Candidatus Gracilibacteria bacterium]